MNTDLILLDDKLHGIGILKADIDFEIGYAESLNNFEMLSTPLNARGLYIEGTEFGGIFEYEHGFSDETKQTLKGWTWRGLLTQGIITPPSGWDYYIASGDANDIIREMLSDFLGGFFDVPETASGFQLNNYQFPLYCDYLTGISGMLESVGAKIKITASKPAIGAALSVVVEAVPVQQIAGALNEDSPVQLEYTYNGMGINHLICMGQGQLQDRQRVDLYVTRTGDITTQQYYTGFDERTAYYDYASAESEADLINDGTKRLQELCNSNLIAAHAKMELDLSIGDTIVSTYKGKMVIAPIIQKILTIQSGAISTEYKVKGEI